MRAGLALLFVAVMSVPAFAQPRQPGHGLEEAAVSALPCEVIAASAPDGIAQRRGCCSWHGGVCGCSGWRVVCCDGRLSPSCLCKDGRPEPAPLASHTE